MEMISADRVLQRLDGFFNKNDYDSAEKHILYWLAEADRLSDMRCKLLLLNELAGLYRKLNRKDDALKIAKSALECVSVMGIENNVGAATTFINCGTVYKAFGLAEDALPLFYKAREIYERELDKNDKRLGGLYNNMALTLVDLKRFDEAYALYDKAVFVMSNTENGMLEVAITYLNIASAKEIELGAEESEDAVQDYLLRASEILDNCEQKDGYYAFVCEKCASVFLYYGHFVYGEELKERARKVYEGA